METRSQLAGTLPDGPYLCDQGCMPLLSYSSGKRLILTTEERPGMEGMGKEVKIARFLITVSVIFGIFAVVTLLVIGIGGFAGSGGFPGASPTGALLLAVVKAAGIGFGLAAYRAIDRGDPRRSGRYALVASLLPPFDLIALFAGLLALFSHREAGAG
ncbi:MAG TPA: hypothetical protein PLG75_01095 [Methanoculleus sp.]|nr:hypothetical protein [Methanoculleus sp.]